MKQILNVTFVLMILALVVTPVFGRGLGNVANTVHNMSTDTLWYNQWASNTDRVCVFCHTPHGGDLTGPLWNHSLPAASSFTHYNSVSLSDYLQNTLQTDRLVNDESLLCLACHDGSVAVDHLINNPNDIGTNRLEFPLASGSGFDQEIQPLNGKPANRIGGSLGAPGGSGDLSDDHPISFSYTAVYDEYQGPGSSRVDELNSVLTAENGVDGVRFFQAANNVECSSCHDPHVNYEGLAGGDEQYRPFLVMTNEGSALCLACHNK